MECFESFGMCSDISFLSGRLTRPKWFGCLPTDIFLRRPSPSPALLFFLRKNWGLVSPYPLSRKSKSDKRFRIARPRFRMAIRFQPSVRFRLRPCTSHSSEMGVLMYTHFGQDLFDPHVRNRIKTFSGAYRTKTWICNSNFVSNLHFLTRTGERHGHAIFGNCEIRKKLRDISLPPY